MHACYLQYCKSKSLNILLEVLSMFCFVRACSFFTFSIRCVPALPLLHHSDSQITVLLGQVKTFSSFLPSHHQREYQPVFIYTRFQSSLRLIVILLDRNYSTVVSQIHSTEQDQQTCAQFQDCTKTTSCTLFIAHHVNQTILIL